MNFFTKRINWKQYLVSLLIVYVVSPFIASLVSIFLSKISGELIYISGLLTVGIQLVGFSVLSFKRLCDAGTQFFIGLLIITGIVAINYFVMLFTLGFGVMISIPVTAIFFAIIPSTVGSNQYGPDPLTPVLIPQPAGISQIPAVEYPATPAVTTVPVV